MKERGQNPVVGDDLNLRLFVYNSNQPQDVFLTENVEIYFLDKTEITESNPDGRRLVATETDISHDKTGEYSISFPLTSPLYTIGKYVDIWYLEVVEGQDTATVEQRFSVLPSLFYTSPDPIVYDFSFGFRPNRIRCGSRVYLTIEINPNVPSATDLERYYRNLATSSPLKISIEQACGDCIAPEKDLRLIVDKEEVEIRKSCEGFYLLDTETLELDCGIYNVWFEMEFGDNKYISENQQLQIF